MTFVRPWGSKVRTSAAKAIGRERSRRKSRRKKRKPENFGRHHGEVDGLLYDCVGRKDEIEAAISEYQNKKRRAAS